MSLRQSASTPTASRKQAGRRKLTSRRRSAGFNLIELMVVVAIGAVLTGIGVSSYRYVTYSNRVSTEVNSLLGDLMLARSEAIKQGVNVYVCPTSTTGTLACSGQNSWQGGWMVFSDVDGSNSYNTGDVLVRVQKAFTPATDTFTSDSGVTQVEFNREGFAVGLPSTSSNFVTITLHTSPVNDQWTRCVQVTTYGGLTTERANKGGCL
jgi:type IV fimbrial biogenesis protein FimT